MREVLPRPAAPARRCSQSRRERREKVTPEVSLHRALEAQRKLLNSLVSQLAHTRGVPHSHVHAELRRKTGGPARGQRPSRSRPDRPDPALARRFARLTPD